MCLTLEDDALAGLSLLDVEILVSNRLPRVEG